MTPAHIYERGVKMKKSAFDNIPQTFYIDMKDGRSITFSKEEFPMGVRWLHDNKDVRFYSTEGEEVFPVLQFSENDDGRALMLFEEKDWANDYYGKYTYATGINVVIEFERFINDILSDDVYIDYGDEEMMESTKKMKKSIPSIHDMIAQTRANNNSLVKSRVDIGKSTGDVIMSDKSPYELVRIQDDRITDESELSSLINLSDRYHIVDYSGKTLATAKTLEDCIPQINKVSGWGADAVIDQKNLVAYDIKYDTWGAGHSYASALTSRY